MTSPTSIGHNPQYETPRYQEKSCRMGYRTALLSYTSKSTYMPQGSNLYDGMSAYPQISYVTAFWKEYLLTDSFHSYGSSWSRYAIVFYFQKRAGRVFLAARVRSSFFPTARHAEGHAWTSASQMRVTGHIRHVNSTINEQDVQSRWAPINICLSVKRYPDEDRKTLYDSNYR